MLATSQTLPSSKASIVTVEFVLSAIGSASPPPCVPKWSPCLIAGSAERDASRPVLDRLIVAMAGAGRSVAELSLYLGLDEPEIRNRVRRSSCQPRRRNRSAGRSQPILGPSRRSGV